MCLILFAYRTHPTFPLIVAANRDEFYERPTAQAHFWEDHPPILAGRDLEKLGTWMGINSSGAFAALTNYRDPKESSEGKRSRGELVADFLKWSGKPQEYLQKIEKSHHLYPGFNLLIGNTEELYYYSNRENQIQKLGPGIYGVSNHLLNTEWPKVNRGKEGLGTLMNTPKEEIVEMLLVLLQSADIPPDEFLPSTGVSIEWERILSPMFIESDGYGTRSSTVMLAGREEIFYKERVFTKKGMNEREFMITLPKG
jgi:uncharacterized protein with NRDE domain